MSDGPNGVRGSSHFVSTPAQCLPCATSLASTFDADLVNEVGAFLAQEAKTKSAVTLLAPTCNIQRSPLGGRSFESFSEDPHLSGSLAAAYVNGLQTNGVAATIKHFVANDQEHERMGVDSIVSERALREIYLYPFMLAQRDAKPWAYMTAYNRLGGIHCSEDPRLLKDILRKEWGFDGLVMSDWFGTYSVAEGLNAGLDLEMPGPPRWRTSLLINHCLTSQKLVPSTLNERVETVLRFVQKLAQVSPEIVFGDGIERTRDTPEMRSFARKLASEGMVLLRNEANVLPIKPGTKLAVIGPNAKARVIAGGGSANLKASYVVSPLQGIESNKPDGVTVEYAVGCYAHKFLPTLEESLTTPSGKSGWLCAFYNHDAKGEPLEKSVAEFVLNDTRVKLNDFLPAGLTETWTIKLNGKLKVDSTGLFEFGLTVAGRAKLYINSKLVVDNWTKQQPGDFFYGQGTREEKGLYDLEANQPVDIYVEYTNTLPTNAGERSNSQPSLMKGVRLGGAPKINPDAAIQEAVALAKKSDTVVVVVGLNSDWESEGFDRPTLDLPGKQNELIAAVANANPKTVVAIQAGSAVAMPWHTSVSSVVQAWLSGNEAGNSLADVLFGHINPAGKLPITLPAQEEDVPAYLNYGSENGQVHYKEDLFVGYKWYQARKIQPLYPFGFGLSYTSFSYSSLKITPLSSSGPFAIAVSFKVTNTGKIAGSEAAQVYVTLPSGGPTTPKYQLRSFKKVRDLQAGETREVQVTLDKYSVSFWDVTAAERKKTGVWRAREGKYRVVIGSSSVHHQLSGEFEIKNGFIWEGL
ncbi:glycoside hydrolase family 3 protein [Ramaria rubella]|nr:glycoside hydrolase family 3 protein [Ramaria rubella]